MKMDENIKIFAENVDIEIFDNDYLKMKVIVGGVTVLYEKHEYNS